MRSSLYVVGGRQRALRPLTAGDDWYEYEAGIIATVDATGHADVALEYVSPPEVCPSESPTILFKSGSLSNGKLYLTTQTEILVLGLPSLEKVNYISLPHFNDVHHVTPLESGNMAVAISGLDMVMELTPEGEIVNSWDVTGSGLWHRFSPTLDYRLVRTTKPHAAHPNFLFVLDSDLWVTRFEQRDAINLTGSGRIEIGLERVHDGVVHGQFIYFTTVDGHLAVADGNTRQLAEVVDLASFHPEGVQLGWTRGVHVADEGLVWVGFSRLRPTKFRENISWVARGFTKALGTHIALYDLKRRRCLTEVSLEDAGLSAVFGIFPFPTGTASG